MTVEWVQSLDLIMPVQRFEIQIRRRKGERVIALDWNPLTRQLDQAPDEFTYSAGDARLVCDEALHLVSPAGLASCSGLWQGILPRLPSGRLPEMRPPGTARRLGPPARGGARLIRKRPVTSLDQPAGMGDCLEIGLFGILRGRREATRA